MSRWAKIDRRPDSSTLPWRDLLTLAAFLLVGVGAPVRRTMSIHQGFGLRAAALVAVGLIICTFLWTRRRAAPGPWLTLGVCVLAALAAAAAGGRHIGAWTALTWPLAAWVVLDRELPFLPRFAPGPRIPFVITALWAAITAPTRTGLAIAITLVAVVSAPLLAGRAGIDATVRERTVQLTRLLSLGVRRVVLAFLLIPLWMIVVALPWLAGRLTRFDGLGASRKSRTTWIEIDERELAHTTRLWFNDPGSASVPLRRQLHRWTTGVVGLVLVAAPIGAAFGIRARSSDQPNDVRQALEQPAWFGDLEAANDGALSRIWFSQYAGNEWADTRSTNLNITDGRRHTWRATSCVAAPIRVWFFGGSTGFGVYQRDDHTLPSALAKAGAEEGWNLVVENFSMVGDVAWLQNRRLERALASQRPPDVIVYYDGWNDLRAVVDMDFTGRGTAIDFVGPMDRIQHRVLSDLGGMSPGGWRVVRVPEPRRTLTDPQAVALAARSYAAADRTARLLSGDAGVPFVHLYQPSLLTRDRPIDGEPAVDPPARRLVDGFRTALPNQVIDLGDALEGSEAPVYYDEAHTLEWANPTIAAALLDELRPSLGAPTPGSEACR